jgi:hypothetical protein
VALVILILYMVVYAAFLASIQEARSNAGVDVATPPWWERRTNVGTP